MKVSVCIPTYNGAANLENAIQGVLAQSCDDFEFIICDDKSTDNTPQILRRVIAPHLLVVHNPTRLGLVGNWNQCIEYAKGDYIYIFHQDDLMSPDDIIRKVKMLDANPDVGFVFSNIHLIDSLNNVIGGHWTPILPAADTIFTGSALFDLLIGNGNLIPCPTVMVRSVCYQQFGRFDTRLRYSPDLEMWLRLCLHTNAAYLADPLVSIRRHEHQESTKYMGMAVEVEEVWRAFEIIFHEQTHYIDQPGVRYAHALSHLQRWTLQFMRSAMRNIQPAIVLTLLRLLLLITIAKTKGLR